MGDRLQATLKPGNDCSSIELWKEFLDGRLDSELIDRMSEHLQVCSRCSDTIDSIASHTQVDWATYPDAITDHLLESQFSQLIQWLQDPEGLRQAAQQVDHGAKLERDQSIGRFCIRGELGNGGFGRVYLADDPLLNRQVAIKVPHESRRRSESESASFIQEARNAAALEHPGIVPIYDVIIEQSSVTLIVMKYVAGQSLAMLHKGSSLAPQRAMGIIRQVALAIHAAHELGFVHRDLKPGNVLVDDRDIAYVTDFGLGIFLSESQLSESSGGTPFYMSPEQVQRTSIDRRSDIWALGVMIAELIHGARPFPQRKRSELFNAISTGTPQLSIDTQHDSINCIIQRCLEKNPERRYPNALDLAHDLDSWLHRQALVGIQKWRYGWRRNLMIFLGGLIVAGSVVYSRTAARNSELRLILNQLETAPSDQVPKLVRQVNSLKPSIDAIDSTIQWDDDCLWKRDLTRIASSNCTEADCNRLCDYLEKAPADHIAAVSQTLVNSSGAAMLANLQADRLLRTDLQESGRLNLAAGLAGLDREHPVWNSISENLCKSIVNTPLFSTGPWMPLLDPIGSKHLADKLFDLSQSSALTKIQRVEGAKSLVQFLRNESMRLTELATRCDASELQLYLNSLSTHQKHATEELQRRWNHLNETEEADDYSDLATATIIEQQKARAAILLAALGELDAFEDAVQDRENPTLRTLVVHGLSDLVVNIDQLMEIIDQRKDDHSESAAALKFSLLQVITLAQQNVNLSKWDKLIQELWLSDPDPGVHSATRLLANRIGCALAPLKPGTFGKWLVEPIGVTQQDFLIVPPGVAWVGRNDGTPPQPATSPWKFHQRAFTRTIAIATNEVTIQQFKPLKKEVAEQLLMRGPADAAMIMISLNDAYRFCNWLSESAGLEPCYAFSSDIPETLEPKQNHLDLSGYRLPTDAEWERVCRAGTWTSRHMGNTPELVERYAWTADNLDQAVVENRLVVSQPVAKLLSNRWGLFDLYGNALEMCDPSLPPSDELEVDETENSTGAATIADQLAQLDLNRRHYTPLIRGSSYIIRSEYARSHCRSDQLVGITTETKGFRLVRTITEPTR